MSFSRLLLASLLLTACGTTAEVADPGTEPDPSGQADGSPSAPTDPGVPAATGPKVSISVVGSTSPVPHGDGLSGQTPATQAVAIRSLYLLRTPTDPNPVKVFDLGAANAAEVELVSGKKVEVATVVAKTLPAGVFTMAKAGVTFVRYAVAARMHGVVALDGRYENYQALSDGAVIDGVVRAKGDFRYAFVANGATLGALEGKDAPVPTLAASGGLSLDGSGSDAFYVFPVQVAIDPNVTVDHEATLEINVHESFRWQDQSAPGYTPKVFDTTPSSFEPIVSFGASASALTIAPKR